MYRVEGNLYVYGRILPVVSTTPSAWQANTRYGAGDIVVASGRVYVRNGAGTSGATFDATEQAFWTVNVNVVMTGASAGADGVGGNAPAPLIADELKFLTGAGVYALPAGNFVDYSTTETALGYNWIDGKPVFRIVKQFQGGTGSSSTTIAEFTGIAENIVRGRYTGAYDANTSVVNRSVGSHGFDANLTTGVITVFHAGITFSAGFNITLILDYTKI